MGSRWVKHSADPGCPELIAVTGVAPPVDPEGSGGDKWNGPGRNPVESGHFPLQFCDSSWLPVDTWLTYFDTCGFLKSVHPVPVPLPTEAKTLSWICRWDRSQERVVYTLRHRWSRLRIELPYVSAAKRATGRERSVTEEGQNHGCAHVQNLTAVLPYSGGLTEA